ncbi:hypothetical protein [Acrocarpospora sp. B8E8]|uniref:hypothetical protein n=1 Tax=Acrocarpospora sp. B8E8 TaxID=3153572 RepID=UPI00325D44C1
MPSVDLFAALRLRSDKDADVLAVVDADQARRAVADQKAHDVEDQHGQPDRDEVSTLMLYSPRRLEVLLGAP